jgi:hypothetical protein
MTVDTLLESAERAAAYFNTAIQELESSGISRTDIVKGVDSVKGRFAKKILELALAHTPMTSTHKITVPDGAAIEDGRAALIKPTVKDETIAASGSATNGHEGNTSRMPILKDAIREISTLNISHESKLERYKTVIRTELERGVLTRNIYNVYDGDLELDQNVRTALQAVEAELALAASEAKPAS